MRLRNPFRRDPFPTVTQRRAYLQGLPQAVPYVLTSARVVDEPAFHRGAWEERQRLMDGYVRARREENLERFRNAPIVGVTFTVSTGEEGAGAHVPSLPVAAAVEHYGSIGTE